MREPVTGGSARVSIAAVANIVFNDPPSFNIIFWVFINPPSIVVSALFMASDSIIPFHLLEPLIEGSHTHRNISTLLTTKSPSA